MSRVEVTPNQITSKIKKATVLTTLGRWVAGIIGMKFINALNYSNDIGWCEVCSEEIIVGNVEEHYHEATTSLAFGDVVLMFKQKEGNHNGHKTKVFYWKDPVVFLAFHSEAKSSPEIEIDRKNYVEITFKSAQDEIQAQVFGANITAGLERIFREFNGDSNPLATPKGQLWIKQWGLHHTSMSVGDVVEVDVVPYVCLPEGWKKIKWKR